MCKCQGALALNGCFMTLLNHTHSIHAGTFYNCPLSVPYMNILEGQYHILH